MQSLHHNALVIIVINNPNPSIIPDLSNPENNITPPIAIIPNPIDVVKGQGDGSTKWNGCACVLYFISVFLFFTLF